MLLSLGLIWFWVNLRNFNPRKIQILDSFRYETIFSLHLTMTTYIQSDVKFYGESNGAYHVTASRCTKKNYTKNLEKVEKIMNIQEYSKKI